MVRPGSFISINRSKRYSFGNRKLKGAANGNGEGMSEKNENVSQEDQIAYSGIGKKSGWERQDIAFKDDKTE